MSVLVTLYLYAHSEYEYVSHTRKVSHGEQRNRQLIQQGLAILLVKQQIPFWPEKLDSILRNERFLQKGTRNRNRDQLRSRVEACRFKTQ